MTTGIIVGATSSPASSPQPDRIEILAGSPTKVVYADYPMMANHQPDYSHGELRVMTRFGHERDLGSTPGSSNPADPTHYSYSIIGPTVTAYSAAAPSAVLWWNVSSHTHGTGVLASGATWEGSAPDGWLVVAADHLTVATQSIAGGVTSYGKPVPSEPLTGSVRAVPGPAGIATLGRTSGTLAFQSWTEPGTVIPLSLGDSAGSPGLDCGDASRPIVACVDRGADGLSTTELSIPLDGSDPHAVPGCGATPIAVGDRAVWQCGTKKSHLWFGGGAVARRSKAPITTAPAVAAFGRVVTTGPRRAAVVSILNATSPVRTLLAIPSPLVRYDNANLRAAAAAVQQSALASGALEEASTSSNPAVVLQDATTALIRAARVADPSLRPFDARSVMGAVPALMRHHSSHRPHHRHIHATHTLQLFRHGLHTSGSNGIGIHATHGGNAAAGYRRPDGVYVDPKLPMPSEPTVSMVAIRSALQKLGQPYVWAGAGPKVFDCSGLVQWAYAHAGRRFTHFSGSQYNEGRLLKPRQVLPGDLVLFDHWIGGRQVIHHVGIYLGAGWMINAPYTGQYVNVVRVPGSIAGIVRP